jgi:hypothetical protein
LNAKNVLKVSKTLYGKSEASTLKVDDHARISKAKRTFVKGCIPNWTTELFTISRNVPGCNAYGIKICHREELEWTFYAKELQ